MTKVDEHNPTESGAEITIGKTIHLRSFCVRFYVKSMQRQKIFISDDQQLQLMVYFETYHGFININRQSFIFSVPDQPPPFSYQHLCFTHNETHYFVACEGKLWFKSQFHPKILQQVNKASNINNILFGPGLEKGAWYFTGKVSGLNIFSTSFTQHELITLTNSCSKVDKGVKLFDWKLIQPSDVTIQQDMNIKMKAISNDYFCSKKNSVTVGMIPFAMKMELAHKMCKAWSGNLFLPQSSNDLEKMIDLTTNGGEILRNYTYNGMCKGLVWFPIYKYDGLDKWVDYDNHSKEAVFEKSLWIHNDGASLQKCAIQTFGSSKISDRKCIDYYCFFCSWKPYLTYRLRGLCENSNIENSYILSNNFQRDEFLRKKTVIFI